MKLYLYIRLSSSDDDLRFKTESDSITHQRSLLHNFVDSRKEFYGWDIEEFVDDGYTGTNGDRPAFNRMIEHLKDGDAQLVICKDFSRFFRDYTEIGDYLERIFPFLGVRFISVNDGYDSDDYKGTTAGMEVVMKYVIYSFYSKDLSMKVKTSIEAKMKRGEFVPGSIPYGYMKNPDDKHHLMPDPEAASVVRKIFAMAVNGKTAYEIARILNAEGIETPAQYFHRKFPDSRKFKNTSPSKKWDHNNVRAIIKRLDYTGSMAYRKKNWIDLNNKHRTNRDKAEWIIVPNCHEALVSEADYNQAQKTIKKVVRNCNRSEREYPLRSLVRCSICGRIMHRYCNVKRTYYKCDMSRYDEATRCPIDEKYYEDKLESVVEKNLHIMLSILIGRVQLIEKTDSKSTGDKGNLEISLHDVEKRIKQNNLARMNGYEQYAAGKISRDTYLKLKSDLNNGLEQLSHEKSDIENNLKALNCTESSEITTTCKNADDFLHADNIKNDMLLPFIECVNVYSGMKVEIKYKFSDEILQVLCSDSQI